MTPHEIADQIEQTHGVPRELLDQFAQAVAESASEAVVNAIVTGVELCDGEDDVLDIEATAGLVMDEWRDDWLAGVEL
jgi:hypothetical protein